jgi:tetratricopeptide (TPR) repeat protein
MATLIRARTTRVQPTRLRRTSRRSVFWSSITLTKFLVVCLPVFVTAPRVARAELPCSEENDRHFRQLYDEGRYQDALLESRGNIGKLTASHAGACALALEFRNYSAAAQQLGELTASTLALRRSLQLWQELGPKGNAQVYRTRVDLLSLYLDSGDFSSASQTASEVVRTRRPEWDSDPQDAVHTLNNLAAVYTKTNRLDLAEGAYQEAIAAIRRAKLENWTDTAMVLNNLAILLLEKRRFDEADTHLAEALLIMEANLGTGHPRLVPILITIAGEDIRAGRKAEAEQRLSRALRISESADGGNHSSAGALELYGQLLRKTGRKKEAHEMEKRSRSAKVAETRNQKMGQTTVAVSELRKLNGR